MVDRAHRWVHLQIRSLREWREHGPDAPLDGLLTRALAGVEALEVAGALSAGEAAEAVRRLREEVPRAPVVDGPEAAALLERLLEEVPPGPEPPVHAQNRFEGALFLLATIGAADGLAWDARMRERLGWPTLEEELA